MLNFTNVKTLTIPEGKVKKITRKSDGVVLWEKATKSYTNIVETVGYTDGHRLNSSGVVVAQSGYTVLGMVDVSAYTEPVVIRTKGVNFYYSYCYIVCYNEDGSMVSLITIKQMVDDGTIWRNTKITADGDGNIVITISNPLGIKFFRIAGYGSGANLIVTINEEITGAVTYINQIPISTDSAGAIYGADYNGDGVNDGYKKSTRISSTGSDKTDAYRIHATGFIPCTTADTLYFKNCQIKVLNDTAQTYQEIACYDSEKGYINKRAVDKAEQMSGKDYSVDDNGYLTRYNCADLWANTAFVRITGDYIGDDSIITKNQPID